MFKLDVLKQNRKANSIAKKKKLSIKNLLMMKKLILKNIDGNNTELFLF